MVLEDNCYHDFAYDSPPPPTLRAYDDHGVVIQSDSFSKYVAPGLRMAWVAGHPTAIDGLVQVRQDFAVSALLARALERYCADGAFDRHVAELRERYRHKRDVTTAALREHCEPLVSFREPTGGFYFWLRISDEVDWAEARALAAEAGVAVRAGDRFGDGADARPPRAPLPHPGARRRHRARHRRVGPGVAGRSPRRARDRRLGRWPPFPSRRPTPTPSRWPPPSPPRGTPRTSRPPSPSSPTTASSSRPGPASTARGCRGATSCGGCGAPASRPSGASMETEATYAAGDLVVQQWRFVDGDRVIRGVDLLRVRDGRISEKLGYVKA